MIPDEAIKVAKAAILYVTVGELTTEEADILACAALEAAAHYIRAQTLNDAADRIIGPSEHLRDAATCRDIASELRRERAGCNLNI